MSSPSETTSTSPANRGESPSAFNDLPIEIISIILRITVNLRIDIFNENTASLHYRRMSTLASVCSLWKSVIDATPTLWSVFDGNLSSAINHRAIEKSGASPLAIRISIAYSRGYSRYNHSDHELSYLLKCVCPHMHRWYDVSLEARASTPGFVTLLSGAAPLIKFCSIRLCNADPIPINLFGGNAVALERLTLKGVPIDLRNLRFLNLRHLEMDGALIRAGTSHIADELAGFLNGSPNLQSITVQRYPDKGNNNLSRFGSPPNLEITLHLPQLRYLKVMEDVGVSLPLAACLDTTQKLATLHITCNHDMQWLPLPADHLEATWKQCIRKFFAPMGDLSIDISTTEISLEGWRHQATGRGNRRFQDSRTRPGDVMERVTWLADLFEAENIRSAGALRVRVSLLNVEPHVPHLISQLQRLNRVTHFILGNDHFQNDALPCVLSILHGRGLPAPCFPTLESVDCSELGTGGQSLLKALRTRNELYPSLPKLHSLSFSSRERIPQYTIESLEELLGPGVLHFRR